MISLKRIAQKSKLAKPSFKLAWGISVCLVAAISANTSLAQVANFGNMYVPAGGSIGMSASFTNNATASFVNDGNTYLAANLINHQAALSPGTGATYFSGLALQSIGGTQPFYAHNMYVDKTNNLQLDAGLFVNGMLSLNNGIVNTSASNLLVLQPTATVGGTPGIASFVNGPMVWQTNAAGEYHFPVGKTVPSPQYQPVGILTGTPSGVTSFTTEFVAADPTDVPYSINFADAAMDGVYNNRYWTITKDGDASAKVIIDYSNPGSSGWTPIAPSVGSNVAVARWEYSPEPNPSLQGFWKFTRNQNDFNNSGPLYEARYYTSAGKIYTADLSLSSDFNAFTIGHGSNKILPFTLLTFDAALINNNDGWLQWTVADDGTLAGFDIQHSTDGTHFITLSSVASTGNTRYGFVHPALSSGNHYYKLLLKGKNGTTKNSSIKLLKIDKTGTYIKGLRQTVVSNEVKPIVFSARDQQAEAMMYDAVGRVIVKQSVHLQKGLNEFTIKTSFLAAGTYFISVFTTDGVKGSLQFLKPR